MRTLAPSSNCVSDVDHATRFMIERARVAPVRAAAFAPREARMTGSKRPERDRRSLRATGRWRGHSRQSRADLDGTDVLMQKTAHPSSSRRVSIGWLERFLPSLHRDDPTAPHLRRPTPQMRAGRRNTRPESRPAIRRRGSGAGARLSLYPRLFVPIGATRRQIMLTPRHCYP